MKGSSEMAKTPRRVREEYRGTMELERELVVPKIGCNVETHPDREYLDHQVHCSTRLVLISIVVTVARCLLFDRVLDPFFKFLYCFPSCDDIFLPQCPENDNELWWQQMSETSRIEWIEDWWGWFGWRYIDFLALSSGFSLGQLGILSSLEL